ncbi:PREDICTED: metal tolerance protein C2 isoform X2 [Nelumbo nucifera]|uniref:Metal tolerance protein C2 isoform X2 n=1 Tax=Nelumbo nucifera TaxID=4432 RepID=A0A1U7ZV00_NELNU|nr:PREDICTED: metal tolerance protein C2 isoform X2 [Nelumbo nucifera]
MENSRVSRDNFGVESGSRFSYHRSKSLGFQTTQGTAQQLWNGEFGFSGNDRRFAFSRQSSFHQSAEPHTPISIISNDSIRPLLSRSDSSINIPQGSYPQLENENIWKGTEKSYFREADGSSENFSFLLFVFSAFQIIRSGSRPMKRLLMMIWLNVAYSTAELCIGLFTGRVGLVSDAFHLTFGCGLLTFSLFAMAASRKKPDGVYTYGYKRLEVLSAFTNALFLLFLSFSLAVEALHAFIQDESEHKHYLIVSAVTNLLVNLLGVWFFRNYARINLVYRNAEDMNYHSVCLHVLADSIRSAGLILASWFLTLGTKDQMSTAIFIFWEIQNVSCTKRNIPLEGWCG